MEFSPTVFLFFIFISISPCYGDYSIGFHEENNEITDSEGAEINLSFWDLPLKLQIVTISVIILALGWKISALLLASIKKYPRNKNRQDILEFIGNNPGATVNQIKKDRGINRGTVRYHVNVLKEAGKIVLFQNGKNISIFKNERKLWSKKHQTIIEPYMKSTTCKEVCKTIYENPGITNAELSRKMKVSKATISLHTKTLENMNCLKLKLNGRFKKYYIKENCHPDDLSFYEKIC